MNSKVWGHRGCRGAGNPPENSLSAFHSAIDSRVGGIELDVFLSTDGIPVVFHDPTLERMTKVSGQITSLTLPQLKKLRLLTSANRPSKETIPTLAEVLDLVSHILPLSPTFVVNIEIKDPNSVPAVAALVSQRLTQGWSPQNFLLSSFLMPTLRLVKSLLPTIPLGTLFECDAAGLPAKMAETSDIQPATINIPITALTPAVFEAITAAGAHPVVWTPNESNPNSLPPLDRDKLVKFIRERDFVTITDFPKELLHWLKPSKTKATVTGVLAACLAFSQQDMLFRPTESGLEILKSPSAYPELEHFGFHELPVTADDGVSLMLWERKGAPDRPHFLLFHGNRAHWGDTGSGDPSKDRRGRLKFIRELAASGAGVTAVTLRGFGRSLAMPSEAGFLRDLRAIVDHVTSRSYNHHRLVVAGESLGTWAATQTAVYLTQRKTPPALLSLQNPFTSMAEVGESVVSHLPLVRSLHIGLSATSLDRHVLKSHFYTANLLTELTTSTLIHIATSGKDGLVHPSHSDRLAQIAQSRNLPVVRDIFAEALHSTIPPIEYAQRLLCLGSQSCGGDASDPTHLWGDSLRAIAKVDHLPYL